MFNIVDGQYWADFYFWPNPELSGGNILGKRFYMTERFGGPTLFVTEAFNAKGRLI
jgi:hypothetical protein